MNPALNPTRSAAALVVELDAAIPLDSAVLVTAPGPERRLTGLAAAVVLSDVLRHHRLGWLDVMRSELRLAKLCGRLGSDFPGEREAAYVHAVRFIVAHHTSWSATIRFPATLHSEPRRPSTLAESSLPRFSAPEGDWPTTVRTLRARSVWLSPGERQLLDAVESRFLTGGALNRGEAIRLRNMWWKTELNDPSDAERLV